MNVLLALVLGFGIYGYVQAQPLAPKGKDSKEKIEFLRSINIESERSRDTSIRDRYYLGALSDPAPEVRKFAAYGLRINLLPAQINVLASDPDASVRLSASMSMMHKLTDNGVASCTGASVVLSHLDQLLVALRDARTGRYVAQILGGRPSGETFLPCCMPADARQRISSELEKLDNPVGSSVASEALANIRRCSP